MSIDGTSFCVAGRRAFNLITKNFLGIAAIQTIGDFVLTLARVFVVLLAVFISVALMAVKLFN